MGRIPGLLLLGWLGLVLVGPLAAQEKASFPSAAEVKALLQKEPITDESWPAWKPRLIQWFADAGHGTDEAYRAAERYAGSQAERGVLPARFDQDHLAWYFFGSSFLHQQPMPPDGLIEAELAYRRCIKIAPDFSRGHRNLATALLAQVNPQPANAKTTALKNLDPRLNEAERELITAIRLEPCLELSGIDGVLAQRQGNYSQAIAIYEKMLRKEPLEVGFALSIADCVLSNKVVKYPAERIQPLIVQFPNDGRLSAMYAIGLAIENRPREAYEEIQRARSLGFDPAKTFPPQVLSFIEDQGKPGLTELYLKTMMWFALVYTAVMLVMAVAGLILAMRTSGTGALDLLQKQPVDQLVAAGQIARGQGETVLARLYGFSLMVGLLLFYAAIPFVIVGLLGGTALLLYVIVTSLNRIPIQLIIVIAIGGGVGAWSVFKCLFTRPAPGGFGILKTSEHCPRLYQLLAEVSQRVDTDPVDQVFLAPGASIGVHQEGRGPFGMFGISKRVLTLGFCTLRFLTVGELKAILAHEYAHFSHSDTFYSRFIYQVHMSIEEALYGMMNSGGIFTYVNPFYWFLWLYYKSYSLLAAGYSRSREFLADRMAASLYGSAQFTSALTKVSTDGTLFEMTIYNHISSLLSEQKEFVNMYESFAQYRNEQIPHEERDKLYNNLLGEKGSVFASHPTFAERAEAIKMLPPILEADDRSALDLFDQPDELEKELTRFLTDYMAYLQYLQAQAAQEQQG